MRNVVLLNRISLDGMFASLNDKNFGMDWFVGDPEVEAYVHTLGDPGQPPADTLLMGRRTYVGFEAAWVPFLQNPSAPAPLKAIAEELTQMHKVVFTSSVKTSAWANTTLVHAPVADHVRRLKGQPGGTIMVMGSGTVVHALAAEGLIDQYIFIVTPVIAGGGKPQFPTMETQNLTLVGVRSFPSGNVVIHYRAGK